MQGNSLDNVRTVGISPKTPHPLLGKLLNSHNKTSPGGRRKMAPWSRTATCKVHLCTVHATCSVPFTLFPRRSSEFIRRLVFLARAVSPNWLSRPWIERQGGPLQDDRTSNVWNGGFAGSTSLRNAYLHHEHACMTPGEGSTAGPQRSMHRN